MRTVGRSIRNYNVSFTFNFFAYIRKILEMRTFKYQFLRFCSSKSNVNYVSGKSIKSFEDIPGPKSLPILGVLYKYMPGGEYSFNTLHNNARKNYIKYGSLVREEILPSVNLLHLFNPSDIETVLRNDGRFPERRSHLAVYYYRTNKPDVYNNGGLIATNGEEWWRARSAFQKYLTSPQSAKNFIGTTDKISTEFVDGLPYLNENKVIDDMLPELNRLFLEVICAIAFGKRLNSFSRSERSENSKTSKVIKAAFNTNSDIVKLDQGVLWRYFKTPLYRKMASSQEYLEKFATDMILENVNFFEVDNAEKAEFVSLMDYFKKLQNVDIKDLVGVAVDILMAAIDTTSYSTCFLLYYLANNKSDQVKLFKECLRLLPNKSDPVTNSVIKEALIMKSCLRESLRLNPVSIGIGRILQKDMIISNYFVPKGTIIVTQNMIASRLPQYCNEPLKYKPGRWIKDSEDYELLHPYLSLPFGFGPRSCIARRLAEQTMLITVMKIIRNFDISWVGGPMDVKTLLVNKPNRQVTVTIKQRPL